jgi:histidinol-phosphate/aromatic aminotransferase/cobyric acid decarboxylase-like protein
MSNDYNNVNSSGSTIPNSNDNIGPVESLVILVNELREEVRKLLLEKAVEETQLPRDMIEPHVNAVYKARRKLNRPLLESEIQDAVNRFKTMKLAAAYLMVHPDTLKKYCELYQNEYIKRGVLPREIYWRPSKNPLKNRRITTREPEENKELGM